MVSRLSGAVLVAVPRRGPSILTARAGNLPEMGALSA